MPPAAGRAACRLPPAAARCCCCRCALVATTCGGGGSRAAAAVERRRRAAGGAAASAAAGTRPAGYGGVPKPPGRTEGRAGAPGAPPGSRVCAAVGGRGWGRAWCVGGAARCAESGLGQRRWPGQSASAERNFAPSPPLARPHRSPAIVLSSPAPAQAMAARPAAAVGTPVAPLLAQPCQRARAFTAATPGAPPHRGRAGMVTTCAAASDASALAQAPPPLACVAELPERYRGVLLDQFGVRRWCCWCRCRSCLAG